MKAWQYGLLTLVAILVGSYVWLSLTKTEPIEPFEASSRVLVSADHLGEIPGYTKVYSEEATDTAIYIRDDYSATAPPVGAILGFNGHQGTLVSSTAREFIMAPDELIHIYPGVSGSPVYYQDTPIGFISGWNGDGNVRCIFY